MEYQLPIPRIATIQPQLPLFLMTLFSYLPALPSFDPVDGEDARQVDRLSLPRGGGGGAPVVPAAATVSGVGRGRFWEDEDEEAEGQRQRLPRRRHGDREQEAANAVTAHVSTEK